MLALLSASAWFEWYVTVKFVAIWVPNTVGFKAIKSKGQNPSLSSSQINWLGTIFAVGVSNTSISKLTVSKQSVLFYSLFL